MVLTLGEMDENVHFSLSMKVANELIKENKDFDMLIVPNTDHSGVWHSALTPHAVLLFMPSWSCRDNSCDICSRQSWCSFALCVGLSTSTWVGVRGPYAIRRMWDYFVTHLQGQTPPKEYEIRGAGELAVTH